MGAIALLLAAALGLGVGEAQAQTAVCSNTPGTGERIECTEDGDSTDDIDIDVKDVTITTNGQYTHGIYGLHQGTAGDVNIDAQGVTVTTIDNEAQGIYAHTSLTTQNIPQDALNNIFIEATHVDIITTGQSSNGISAWHESQNSTGNITVKVRYGTINTNGRDARGISVIHQSKGNISVDVRDLTIRTMSHGVMAKQHVGGLVGGDVNIYAENLTIETSGVAGHGILGWQDESMGDLHIDVRNSTIKTSGTVGVGVYGIQYGKGDIHVDTRNVDIETTGTDRYSDASPYTYSRGIYALHRRREGDVGEGDINIDAQGGSITTNGTRAHGIYSYHQNTGDIHVDVRNVDIEITGTDRYSEAYPDPYSHGIYALHSSVGDINIDGRGGSVTTKGEYSYAIYGRHLGDGNLTISTQDHHIITTMGDYGHAIVAHHLGTMDSRTISIIVGGDIDAKGNNARGVGVGVVNSDGEPESVAVLDGEGYRKQTVAVNGRISGGTDAGTGVFLAGGGKVYIGPRGSVGAQSGIAILATGDTPPVVDGDPPIKPKLYVDIKLDGRRVEEVIGDDWIINDGGKTTIVINDVKLHDGSTTGVVSNTKVPNGAFDISIRADGLTTGRSVSPWTFSDRSTMTIADRDFSVEDFIEEYAPRAAVYEAFPGFLLRLDARGLSEERLALPDSPVWMRLSSGWGSYEPERASVDAEFDFSRFSVEAGLDVSLDENATGFVSVRIVRGSAEVAAPTGGGEIEAEGLGLSLGVSLSGANDYYTRGRYSLTAYTANLASNERGRLQTGVEARAHTLDFEVGRRMAVGKKMNLTHRVWMIRSHADIDGFSDAVDTRVSSTNVNRFIGGLGVVAETAKERNWRGGALSLRASVDLERTLGGAETSVDVSGENLYSETAKTRLLLGLGGTYRKGRFSMGAEVSARGLGSGDTQYGGKATFGWKF